MAEQPTPAAGMPHTPAPGCTCRLTDPSTWGIYAGLSEPGDTVEWNPECPEHGEEMPRPAPEAAAPGLAAEKRPEGRTGVSETLSEAHAIEEGIAREWIAIPADDATEEWGVRRRDGRVQRFEDRADAEEFAEAWRDLDRTVVHRYVGPWESAARDEEDPDA